MRPPASTLLHRKCIKSRPMQISWVRIPALCSIFAPLNNWWDLIGCLNYSQLYGTLQSEVRFENTRRGQTASFAPERNARTTWFCSINWAHDLGHKMICKSCLFAIWYHKNMLKYLFYNYCTVKIISKQQNCKFSRSLCEVPTTWVILLTQKTEFFSFIQCLNICFIITAPWKLFQSNKTANFLGHCVKSPPRGWFC